MGESTRREDDNDGRRQDASDGRDRDDRMPETPRTNRNQGREPLTKREREQRWPIG
jgi:hypothetical protein